MNPLRCYIGFDKREQVAFDVARASLIANSSRPVSVTPLYLDRLADCGLLRRPQDLRGQRYDILSNAPASTEFAISRFLVPLLAQTGWALFTDCDVVFLGDIARLFALADDSKALMVVKHAVQAITSTKMDGQTQSSYPRKNWSSVMLFNCDHPANRRLSLDDIQGRRGFDLHQFYWLSDDEIGPLPAEWNWLVNCQPKPAYPQIAHFTLGGPFIPGWTGAPNDDLWLNATRYLKVTA
jgi:hypothetical protein